ncbi:hypothetical protein GCM10020358_49790 [Amorphoplanes nipponensis]|uniref:Uncharacterized protein n=1 Tax=Actinoplanes nipponensis TaxID=135950 RepID=A0A919JM36_9ACTN|nr:DUF6518 family protein [Actinoplanes nipponensis]GIE53096.1 hypothetical protein Ani05nite_66300 [Actinoplanes nipponensis]
MINRYAAPAALIGGVLLGVLDFVWIKYVPFPFGGLGNSLAVWAVAAFLFTYRGRWGWARGIAAAVVLLVVAVPSYHLAAALIQHDDVANMVDTVALLWMGCAVVAGVVFGGAGVAARRPGPWQAAAAAMPAAVLVAEAALLARRIGDPRYGSEPVWPALIDVALGVVVTVLVAGTGRRRVVALLLAVPLAAVGFALLSLARFG